MQENNQSLGPYHHDHVLEIEIVAGVFPPVAKNNTEHSIESYLALKIVVTVMYLNKYSPEPPYIFYGWVMSLPN